MKYSSIPAGFKRNSLCLILCLFFGLTITKAAVTVDNSSSQGAFSNTGVTSLSFSHTIGTGNSRALFVGVSTFTSNVPIGIPAQRIGSVTFNGVNLTRIGTQLSPGFTPSNSVEMFLLVDPPISPQNTPGNIVVTFSNVLRNPFVNYAFAGAVSFNGVDQNAPNGIFSSSSGTDGNPNVTVTDSAVGDLIFDTVSSTFGAGSFVAGTNQTVCTDINDQTTCRRGRRFFGGLSDVGASSIKNESGASVLMSWTLNNSADWAISAVAVKSLPASAASGTIQGRVLTTGGRGISRAVVSITGSGSEIQRAQTNSFGYFRFNEVSFGETYIVQVNSKEYVFSPQVITFDEDLSGLNLTAIGN